MINAFYNLVKTKEKIVPQQSYYTKYSKMERLQNVKYMIDKYPDRVPIIIKKGSTLYNSEILIKEIPKMFQKDKETLNLVLYIRNSINLNPTDAIYILINDKYPVSLSEKIGDLYDKYNIDGIMNVVVHKQNTFG